MISPMIISEGWEGTLTIRGEYPHARFEPMEEYTVEFKSTYFHATNPRRKMPIIRTVTAKKDGSLAVPFAPDIEGEWIVRIEPVKEQPKSRAVVQALYVLSRQLRGYRAYIGDLHAHSTRSDGAQIPAYPPARARTLGYDFFALTDHWCYDSSNEMIRETGKSLGSKMLLLNGEEMHPEKELLTTPQEEQPHAHYYHYVAVGHSAGVREAFFADEEKSKREVRQIAAELEERGVEKGVDLLPYAEGVWKLRKAKELGGVTVFAHPYWATPVNLDIGSLEQTLRDGEVDAVEALSRADSSSHTPNRLSSGGFNGHTYPVVGVSDSHNWYGTPENPHCTFLLAPELSRGALLEAVREGRSVACRMSTPPLLVGPFQYTDLAVFYIDHILPRRRRITALQGNLALSKLRGGAFSQEIIDRLDRDLRELDEAIWGD